jgi:hypothetical protein
MQGQQLVQTPGQYLVDPNKNDQLEDSFISSEGDKANSDKTADER